MTTKRLAKKQYLETRRRRVRELYLGRGLNSRQICELLVKDGTIESRDESLASAIRLVRSDLSEIRAEIDVERKQDGEKGVAGNAVDAMMRELDCLRHSYARQRQIADDESIVTTVMTTPNGEIVMQKPKWPPGVRQRAAKDAATIAKDISKLEAQIANPPDSAGADQPADESKGFRFIFPDCTGDPAADLDRLIALNLERGKVN